MGSEMCIRDRLCNSYYYHLQVPSSGTHFFGNRSVQVFVSEELIVVGGRGEGVPGAQGGAASGPNVAAAHINLVATRGRGRCG